MKKIIILSCTFLILGFLAFFLILSINKKTTSSKNNQSSVDPTTAQSLNQTKEVGTQTTEQKTVSQISLEITEPQNNITVDTSSVTVRGKTIPNAVVFINDQELKADTSGGFTTSISLDEGENTIIIVANDDFGNYSEKEITVNLATLE